VEAVFCIFSSEREKTEAVAAEAAKL